MSVFVGGFLICWFNLTCDIFIVNQENPSHQKHEVYFLLAADTFLKSFSFHLGVAMATAAALLAAAASMLYLGDV